MGYDCGAEVLQGYRLNDFFESECSEELEMIEKMFTDPKHEPSLSDRAIETGIRVFRPHPHSKELYIGTTLSGGGVGNRGRQTELEFSLRDRKEVATMITRVLQLSNDELLKLIVEEMRRTDVKNYLLFWESY